MEDKIIGLESVVVTLLKIERLLEEILFQQILSRTNNLDEANTRLDEALKRVDDSTLEKLESLPPADDIEEGR